MLYDQIVRWLEEYCSKQDGTTLYRGLESCSEFKTDVDTAKEVGAEFFIDPMLPVDLVAVRSQQGPVDSDKPGLTETRTVHQYTLFFLAASSDPTLEKRLQFHRFYLSRIAVSWAVLIVVVVPKSADPDFHEETTRIANDNGLGLWIVDTSQSEPEVICEAKDYLKHMEDALLSPPEQMLDFPPAVKEKAEDLSLFFDRYVREAVEALAGVSPRKFGKRHIERKLLDLVFGLEHISYAKELTNAVTKHLIEKGSDHEFVSTTFSRLWRHCDLKMDYSDFLRVCEPPLYNIFASREHPYRDHYLHQFQVFLLGLAIIDRLAPNSINGLHPEIERQWLIAASFHDMGYPLQLYDSWAKAFFSEALGVPEIGVTDIRSYFVDKSLMSSLGFIVSALCDKHFDVPLQGNWLHNEKQLVRFLHDRMTRLKHHCLLSSLFLLNKSQQVAPELLENVVVPAALAIALHHYHDIWKELPKEPDEAWRGLPSDRKLEALDFSRDPLTFILMYCDSAQEWGRPKLVGPEALSEEGRDRFVLADWRVTSTECCATISTPHLTTTDVSFTKKEEELKQVEKFLVGPRDLEFRIYLKDMTGTPKGFCMSRPRA